MRIARRGLAAAVGLIMVAGCASPAPAVPTEMPTQPVMVSATAEPPGPTQPAPTEAPTPSFEPATYQNDLAGFAFDYPASWTVGPTQQQSRGGITSFTSWSRPADVLPDETPPGETRLDVTVQLWDPKGDLEAFLGQRRGAWAASGSTVVEEKQWTLGEDGRPAASFVVQGSDGAQAYFFFTTLGDDYLVLSGSGDLALLAEIAGTVRPTPPAY